MTASPAPADPCARCRDVGGTVRCPWCGRLFHNTKSLPCLVRHALEEHAK